MAHFVHCKAECGHYSTTGDAWYCLDCYKKATKHMTTQIVQCPQCGYGYTVIDGIHWHCPNCDQPDATAKEQVDHPSHYGGDQPYEVIKVLEAWFPDEQSEAFCLCNAIKYIARAGKKTPDKLEDLKKAQWYLNRVIENLKNT